MDDERLKGMRNIGDDYFDELLERIHHIRASVNRFYKKITDIYALSIDYDGKSEEGKSSLQQCRISSILLFMDIQQPNSK